MNKLSSGPQDNLHFLNYDIGLSSALTTLHYELLTLNRDNPRKIGFVFARTPELEQTAQEYFAGRLMLDARSFFKTSRCSKTEFIHWPYNYDFYGSPTYQIQSTLQEAL